MYAFPKMMLLAFVLLLFSFKKEHVKPFATLHTETEEQQTILAFEKALLSLDTDSLFSETGFNGSVGIFQDKMELFEKSQGYSNFSTGEKISSETVFPIGSITKQFTAAVILRLVGQGKIQLQDSVSHYLKSFRKKNYNKILVKQLLNHTSGINDYGGWTAPVKPHDFNYSNTGYNDLGALIEVVSGKGLKENYKELFSLAGMHASCIAEDLVGKNFGSAYTGSPKNPAEVPAMPARLASKEIGIAAGGILSTVEDLHRWNQALYGGKILKPELLKEMLRPSAERHHPILGKMGYGYGIMINNNPPLAYFHSGYVKGAPSLNIYYPETKTSVIVLSNFADERLGKKQIFLVHRRIKALNDKLQNVILQLRTQK